MEALIDEIKKRINWKAKDDYTGLMMHKTHSQDEINEEITQHNKNLLSKFKDFLSQQVINDFDCWKGVCFLGDKTEPLATFGGWTTLDIIEWLIINDWKQIGKEVEKTVAGEIEYENMSRIITKEQRYEVLKRQKWRCNVCGERLRYNSDSDWKGEVAHIDHIHPFSKRDTYPNGFRCINENSNLQALCPKCNREKSDKEIH